MERLYLGMLFLSMPWCDAESIENEKENVKNDWQLALICCHLRDRRPC